MSDSDIEPKEFQIKLPYKVGSEIHYTTLEQFEFLTIRDSNMIDKEKQKVKEEMKNRIPKENWYNKDEDFKELKTHLIKEDSNEYKFNIPLSSYYFTFDNLQGFLNQKEKIQNIIEKTNNKLTLLEKIKKIQLIDENFSIENGLMTPTMKVKRKKVTEKYKNQLEKLY